MKRIGELIFLFLSLSSGVRYDYEKFAAQATEAFLGPINGDMDTEEE
jgi:hypothetical protein